MAGIVSLTNPTTWVPIQNSFPTIELSNLSRIGDICVYIGATAPDSGTTDFQIWTSDNLVKLIQGIPATHRVWLRAYNSSPLTVDWRPVDLPSVVNLPDEESYALVGSVAKRFVDDFGGNALDANKWDVEMNVGGMTYTVSNSDLNVVMNTTANAELRFLSKAVFTIPTDLYVSAMLSQRLVENGVWFELVEVNPANGQPLDNPNLAGDWTNRAGVRFQGSTTTGNAALEAVSQSAGALASVTTTNASNTTANFDVNIRFREADIWFGSVGVDSTSGRGSGEMRMSRQVPDPDKLYKLRMRFKNAATPPASSTTVNVRSVRVLDLQELQVDFASSGSSSGGNGITLSSSISAVPIQSNTFSSGTTSHRLISTAAVNLVSVKTTAGKIISGTVQNVSAAVKYLKIYNKASAPVVASDIPAFVIPLLPNLPTSLADIVGFSGHSLSAGIAYAITGGAADTDATAVAAGDVFVNMLYA